MPVSAMADIRFNQFSTSTARDKFLRLVLLYSWFFVMFQHPSEYLGGWRNQACARIGAMIGLYSPIKVVDKVKAMNRRSPDYLCNMMCI